MSEKEKSGNGAGEKLLAQALKAYGISPEFVWHFSYYSEEKKVVILTNGGFTVRYREGDEKEKGFAPLTQVQVDGEIPEKPRHVVGKK